MITIDLKNATISINDKKDRATYSLDSPEAFELVSHIWLRAGWDAKYVYSFTWMGRPMIQLPEDMIRLQEVIYRIKPDVIIETGVAHGGALVFYATLCKAIGKGRVIGIDIEIRPHNRKALEEHELYSYLTLFEGSSTDIAIVEEVKESVHQDETILVCLDSNHLKAHVLDELRLYGELVSVGSYIIAMDGIMEQIVGAPRTQADWNWNNARQAALEFVRSDDRFVIEEPPFLFNEGTVKNRVTYWPDAFIKRIH